MNLSVENVCLHLSHSVTDGAPIGPVVVVGIDLLVQQIVYPSVSGLTEWDELLATRDQRVQDVPVL